MPFFKRLFILCWLLGLVSQPFFTLYAQTELPIVRMRAKLSAESRRGVEQFIAFYDELQNEAINQWIRRGLVRQQERIIDGLRGASLGIAYLDEIGRHYLITGANIAMFSDFAQVEYLSPSGFRNLGEAYVIHRDREKDIAIYLLNEDVRPFTTGLDFSPLPLLDGDVALAYAGNNQEGDFVRITQSDRGRWQVSDGLMTNQAFGYGAPVFDTAGSLIGLVGMEQNFIAKEEIKPVLTDAQRLRPRATQGALERASLQLVNTVMAEDYTAFSITFSANLTSSLGIPLFLNVLRQSNEATRNNYISVLRDEDPTLLINTILGLYLMERFNEFEQPIFEQMRVGTIPSNAFESETKISYNLNQKLYSIGWIYSAGSWRVSNLDAFNFIEKRSIFRTIQRSGLTMGLGYSFTPQIHDAKNIHASLGYYHQLHPFFGVSGEILYHSLSYRIGEVNERLPMMHTYFKAQAQVGLAFESFNILAFGGLGMGMGIRLGDPPVDDRFKEILISQQPVAWTLGWFTGIEVGFSENTPIFFGIEGGWIGDYFSNKYLTIHFRDQGATGAFYVKGYLKYRFY